MAEETGKGAGSAETTKTTTTTTDPQKIGPGPTAPPADDTEK